MPYNHLTVQNVKTDKLLGTLAAECA